MTADGFFYRQKNDVIAMRLCTYAQYRLDMCLYAVCTLYNMYTYIYIIDIIDIIDYIYILCIISITNHVVICHVHDWTCMICIQQTSCIYQISWWLLLVTSIHRSSKYIHLHFAVSVLSLTHPMGLLSFQPKQGMSGTFLSETVVLPVNRAFQIRERVIQVVELLPTRVRLTLRFPRF